MGTFSTVLSLDQWQQWGMRMSLISYCTDPAHLAATWTQMNDSRPTLSSFVSITTFLFVLFSCPDSVQSLVGASLHTHNFDTSTQLCRPQDVVNNMMTPRLLRFTQFRPKNIRYTFLFLTIMQTVEKINAKQSNIFLVNVVLPYNLYEV